MGTCIWRARCTLHVILTWRAVPGGVKGRLTLLGCAACVLKSFSSLSFLLWNRCCTGQQHCCTLQLWNPTCQTAFLFLPNPVRTLPLATSLKSHDFDCGDACWHIQVWVACGLACNKSNKAGTIWRLEYGDYNMETSALTVDAIDFNNKCP